MNKKFFSIIAIIFFIIFFLIAIIYIVNASKNEGNLNEKVEEELNYIGKELINMTNCLNNIKFENISLQVNKESSTEKNKEKENENENENTNTNSDDNQELKIDYLSEEKGILNEENKDIDWNYLKNSCERMYNIWTTSIIDLNTLNVNQNDILNFSNILDLATISAKNEDKESLLNNLASLYSYIPDFLSQINSDNRKIQISKTINSILNSYVFVNQNDWSSAAINTEDAIVSYMQIINNVDENSKYSQSKVTRTYVLLNELRNSIHLNDKEIFFIKYKNVIEELINL